MVTVGRWVVGALAAFAAGLVIGVPGARADLPVGQFTLISCTLPDDTPTGMGGWTFHEATRSTASGIWSGDHCDGSFEGRDDDASFARGFGVYLGAANFNDGSTNSPSTSSWTYAVPAATTLVGGSIVWSGEEMGSASYSALTEISVQSDTADGTGRPVFDYAYSTPGAFSGSDFSYEPRFRWGGGQHDYDAGTNDVIATPLTGRISHRGLTIATTCNAAGPSGGVNATCVGTYYVRRAYLTLADGTRPTGKVTGSLATSNPLTGTLSGVVAASDTGAGLARSRLVIDGKDAASQPFGGCNDLGGRQYAGGVAPCPATANATQTLDTTKLSEGAHHIVVSAIDGAGNETNVFDHTLMVDNDPAVQGSTTAPDGTTAEPIGTDPGNPGGGPNPATGRPACFVGSDGHLFNPETTVAAAQVNGSSAPAAIEAGLSSTKTRTRAVGYGRAYTLVGTIKDAAGKPVQNAVVHAVAHASGGSATLCTPAAKTSRTGKYRLTVKNAQVNTTVTAVVFASTGSDTAIQSKALHVKVRAPVSLSVGPKSIKRRGLARYSGKLKGAGRIKGVIVALEAQGTGERTWANFATVRTDSKGRFHGTYRFRASRPLTLRFRAVVDVQPGRPYVRGTSSAASVRVR